VLLKKKKVGGGSPLLTISYKFLANTTDEKTKSLADQMVGRELKFQHKLRLVRQPIDFVVECYHPRSAYKGKRIRFEWKVTCLRETKSKEIKDSDDSPPEFGERYSIKVDNRLWLIAAKANGYLDFDKSNSNPIAAAVCTLIPLVSGIIALPQFRIETTSMARVRDTNSKEDGITVFPSAVITSHCEQIEISDKKKEYLLPKGNLKTDLVPPLIVVDSPSPSTSTANTNIKTPLPVTPQVSTGSTPSTLTNNSNPISPANVDK